MRRKYASQKGASAVEFAILLIPLMFITFGIIEFGVFMYNQQVITNASREGARAGIVARVPARLPAGPVIPPSAASCVNPSNPQDPISISCVVGNYSRNNLVTFTTAASAQSPRVTVAGYAATPTYGDNLTVTVTYDYHFIALPSFVISMTSRLTSATTAGAWPMQAVTVMKYE